jgi:hypothetical protein
VDEKFTSFANDEKEVKEQNDGLKSEPPATFFWDWRAQTA